MKYGSVVAAPYVSAFLGKALPYLGYKSTVENAHTEIENFVGTTLSYATGALKKLNIDYEIIGNGDIILSQTPGADDPFIYNGSKVILYTVKNEDVYVTVPDLVGKNAADANKLVAEHCLNIRIKGINGTGGATVISQSIPPGTVIKKNSIIEIEIIYLDFED